MPGRSARPRKPSTATPASSTPTNEVLENWIAALEGGSGALAVASGSAATATTILNIRHDGDEIVAAKTLYGGSFNPFVNTLPKLSMAVKIRS